MCGPPPRRVSAAEGEKAQNSWLRQTRYAAGELSTPLDGACEGGTLYAVAQPAAVSIEDGKSVSARLVGVEKGYFQLHEPVLLNGRQLYPDECTYGERVAMVDEQLAVALFQYAEPLGEKLVLDGQAYRIVGVVKAHKQVGDGVDYALYVPLRALEKSGVPLTAMVYEARPVKGAGGWPAFQAEAVKLGEGTTVSLVKEKMNAAMPLRMLICLGLGAVALYGVRGMNRAFGRFVARWRERIQEQYAARLLGWALWRGLLLLLGLRRVRGGAGGGVCKACGAGVYLPGVGACHPGRAQGHPNRVLERVANARDRCGIPHASAYPPALSARAAGLVRRAGGAAAGQPVGPSDRHAGTGVRAG